MQSLGTQYTSNDNAMKSNSKAIKIWFPAGGISHTLVVTAVSAQMLPDTLKL